MCDKRLPNEEIARRFNRNVRIFVGYGWQKFDEDDIDQNDGRAVLIDAFWRSLKDALENKCKGVCGALGIGYTLGRLRAGHGRLVWNDISSRINNADILVFDIAASPDETELVDCDGKTLEELVTGFNSNVLVEAGVALGMGKPVLLLCPRHLFKGIPSDLSGFLWTVYTGKFEGKALKRTFEDQYGFQNGFMRMIRDVVRNELNLNENWEETK